MTFGFHDGTYPCSELSYGSKKALDMARMFSDPQSIALALIDEPTAGLTQREGIELVKALSRIHTQHRMAMLVVSHDIMFLESLEVNRVIVLHQGRVFRDGSFAQIRNDPGVQKLFWGDDLALI